MCSRRFELCADCGDVTGQKLVGLAGDHIRIQDRGWNIFLCAEFNSDAGRIASQSQNSCGLSLAQDALEQVFCLAPASKELKQSANAASRRDNRLLDEFESSRRKNGPINLTLRAKKKWCDLRKLFSKRLCDRNTGVKMPAGAAPGKKDGEPFRHAAHFKPGRVVDFTGRNTRPRVIKALA